MAWIEVHEGLIDHPKTWRASEVLGISPAQVVGHLVSLWLWALDSAPDGVLDVPALAIARGARWERKPGKFLEGMLIAGFFERAESGQILIHHWADYAGRLIERRKLNAEKVRRFRENHKLELDNVTVTEPLRNGSTVPNLTVPNLTVPNHKRLKPLSKVAPKPSESWPDFIIRMKGKYPTLDIDDQVETCQAYWQGKGKEINTYHVMNWLRNEIKYEAERKAKQGGNNGGPATDIQRPEPEAEDTRWGVIHSGPSNLPAVPRG